MPLLWGQLRPPCRAAERVLCTGNSSVARTVGNFAPSSLKFLLLTCHPAKRALATYRFRYFGKGEFAFRKKPLRTLEDASPPKLFFGFSEIHPQMISKAPQTFRGFFGLIHLR